MNTSEKIKARRKLLKMTQSELAEATNISVSSIQKYEYGTANPKIEQLTKIATTLKCSPLDLLGDNLDALTKWNYQYDTAALSQQVDLFKNVGAVFGEDANVLLDTYTSLNNTGKKKVQEYIEDMLKLYKEGE